MTDTLDAFTDNGSSTFSPEPVDLSKSPPTGAKRGRPAKNASSSPVTGLDPFAARRLAAELTALSDELAVEGLGPREEERVKFLRDCAGLLDPKTG